MTNRRRNLLILFFVLGLVIASLLVIESRQTKLGLDLQGGTELVYQGRPTPQNPEIDGTDMDRSIEIIRDRCDALGVAEPEFSRLGTDQLRAGIPGEDDVEQATRCVGTTAKLQFYDWQPNVVANPDSNAEPSESTFPRLYNAVKFASEREPECIDNRCTTTGPSFYLFDAQSQEVLAGPAATEEDLYADQPGEKQPPGSEVLSVPQGTLVVLQEPASDNPDTEENESQDDSLRNYFVIRDAPELSGDDIRNPEAATDPTTSQPNVTFDFSDEGAAAFEEVTKRIAERGLNNAPPGVGGNSAAASQYSDNFAVVLDGEVVSRPIINFVDNPAGIDGRTGAQIEGGFTPNEAQDLAEFLQKGALPVDLRLISQSTVSASLGEEALDQGLKAGLAGLILVILFLVAYYRFLGVVATLGLALYGVFFYALVELVPITLTLPGIAGMILTIGVAADSNVVIFERIKEESRSGKSMASAIASGYRKGIATIIDANVITLITAFILFVLSTSSVKGFALVLGLGTLASLFTAVVFTQAFLGIFGRRFLRSPRMMGAGEERVRWHFDFTGMSRWFFSASGVILLVGAISFATLQLNLGIDFESGSRITAGLQEEASVDEVRSTLEEVGAGDAEITEVDNEELGDNAFQLDGDLAPDQVAQIQTALDDQFTIVEDGFDTQSIGPTFGQQVARSAAIAIIFSLLVICAYVAFRFEPKYAVPVIIAVIHDILITGGVYSLAEREVTSGTVAAFLTILGYSLYDTVIVFDRIRENVPRLPRATFSQIVNRSMSEVLTRSLITGLSSVFLVSVLMVFGGETLQDFAFAMLIGIASGTYSSIFIAAPVLTAWKEREPAYRRRRERIEEQMGRVPPFPEENLIARVEEDRSQASPEAPVQPAAPAPSTAPVPPAPSSAPGVLGDTPSVAPPPTVTETEPESPPTPAPDDGGDGDDDGGDGGTPAGQELSEASAAALQRAREQREGGKRGRRRKKHGRPR